VAYLINVAGQEAVQIKIRAHRRIQEILGTVVSGYVKKSFTARIIRSSAKLRNKGAVGGRIDEGVRPPARRTCKCTSSAVLISV